MATPEIGLRMYGYILRQRIALWSHQSALTESSEQCIVQIERLYRDSSLPNPFL